MKIEDLVSEMEEALRHGPKRGEVMSWIHSLKEIKSEITHLADTWRNLSSLRDSPLPDQACYIIGECADQLNDVLCKQSDAPTGATP